MHYRARPNPVYLIAPSVTSSRVLVDTAFNYSSVWDQIPDRRTHPWSRAPASPRSARFLPRHLSPRRRVSLPSPDRINQMPAHT
ncbi:hypothetical protein WJX74_000835 [Apatococcus lobatus]|uniref:Uncharacterized protein n=1 Tax=Apatococcus lobatus TaxID=904363 RepID=A0AAW1R0N9_9CHLO